MKKVLSLLFPLIVLTSASDPGSGDSEWQYLLDEELSQWRIYQSYEHTDGYRGRMPVDANGDTIPPIGYDRNEKQVFTVVREGDELLLHISGEIYGCIFTREDYRNYHLSLKMRWGERKFPPRIDKAMDSGILYHSQGECGVDYWRSWMLSQEFQVMESGTPEGSSGDYWSMAGSRMDIRSSRSGETNRYMYDSSGELLSFGSGGISGSCLVSSGYESRRDEWTTLELICHEGRSLHIVNGQVVMALENSRYRSGDGSLPLVEGKIQLQCEAAELFYKDIRIKSLEALPEEYAYLFSGDGR